MPKSLSGSVSVTTRDSIRFSHTLQVAASVSGVSRDEHAPSALGEAVRQLRVQAGVTQQGLAARLGVPQSWVSNIESARRRLGVLEALDVCAALDIPFRQLLAEYEKRRDASE